jgi:tungstate transport system permease protein
MEYILNGFNSAFNLIFTLDKEFISIVSVSVRISLISTILAGLFGIPLGMWIGTGKFKGRKFMAVVLNTLMSLPTVVIGLTVYSFISRKGPMGNLGLLFTPTAMIIGQFILAFPIVAGISMGGIKNLGDSPLIASRLLGAGGFESMIIFLKEARFIIMTSIIAGFGRVFSEVGVSMMLGGNIRFYTRNITTAIALETSRGEFALSLALGIVLLVIAFIVNMILYRFQGKDT